jgi:hypothetical protein
VVEGNTTGSGGLQGIKNKNNQTSQKLAQDVKLKLRAKTVKVLLTLKVP